VQSNRAADAPQLVGPDRQHRVGLGHAADRRIGLTRALCTELGEDGITINAACPSITDTPMATAGISKEHIAGMVSRQAFKRIAQASDIAGAVMFLTGEDSGWVTGQTILVNAGASFL
jgi:NAD(P)-dependent dehydrogenase (short-subunit alcohol dehydrogenase family)